MIRRRLPAERRAVGALRHAHRKPISDWTGVGPLLEELFGGVGVKVVEPNHLIRSEERTLRVRAPEQFISRAPGLHGVLPWEESLAPNDCARVAGYPRCAVGNGLHIRPETECDRKEGRYQRHNADTQPPWHNHLVPDFLP